MKHKVSDLQRKPLDILSIYILLLIVVQFLIIPIIIVTSDVSNPRMFMILWCFEINPTNLVVSFLLKFPYLVYFIIIFIVSFKKEEVGVREFLGFLFLNNFYSLYLYYTRLR